MGAKHNNLTNAHRKRCDCELPRQSCRLGRACVDFLFTQVLLWFCLELPRKGSAKGGGICDARVEVHPVNWLIRRSENPRSEVQPHFVHSGGRDSFTAFHWESQTKVILRKTFGKQLLCGRLILTHRSRIKRRCIKVFKAHSSQE